MGVKILGEVVVVVVVGWVVLAGEVLLAVVFVDVFWVVAVVVFVAVAVGLVDAWVVFVFVADVAVEGEDGVVVFVAVVAVVVAVVVEGFGEVVLVDDVWVVGWLVVDVVVDAVWLEVGEVWVTLWVVDEAVDVVDVEGCVEVGAAWIVVELWVVFEVVFNGVGDVWPVAGDVCVDPLGWVVVDELDTGFTDVFAAVLLVEEVLGEVFCGLVVVACVEVDGVLVYVPLEIPELWEVEVALDALAWVRLFVFETFAGAVLATVGFPELTDDVWFDWFAEEAPKRPRR